MFRVRLIEIRIYNPILTFALYNFIRYVPSIVQHNKNTIWKII